MTSEQMALKIAEIEHRAVSNTRRIDKLEQQTEAIQSLATSVEVMVKEQSHQTESIKKIEENVEKLDTKVDALERKPGKRWEGIVEKIISALVGGLIVYLLAKIGLTA